MERVKSERGGKDESEEEGRGEPINCGGGGGKVGCGGIGDGGEGEPLVWGQSHSGGCIVFFQCLGMLTSQLTTMLSNTN